MTIDCCTTHKLVKPQRRQLAELLQYTPLQCLAAAAAGVGTFPPSIHRNMQQDTPLLTRMLFQHAIKYQIDAGSLRRKKSNSNCYFLHKNTESLVKYL